MFKVLSQYFALAVALLTMTATTSANNVQITLRNGRMDPRKETTMLFLSLSEIELLNNGINQLGDKPFQTAWPLEMGDGSDVISPTILTDENSVFGKIFPQKQWFLQLARRAELEKKKAELLLEKEALYEYNSKLSIQKHPVSKRVNSVKNDDSSLLDEVETQEQMRLL